VSQADCQDLVQDVFLIAHRKGGYVAGPAQPATWLANIALGEVRNLRRKRGRRKSVSSDSRSVELAPEPSGASDPEGRVSCRSELDRVKSALDRLDEDKRVVFMLFEIEGESCAAIATGLGIPTGTVYSRLHAARRAFRVAFEEVGEAPRGKGGEDR